MNILLDSSVALGEVLFRDLGDLRVVPGKAINTDDLAWADILICRSQVKVNEALLGKHKPFFVGTATAGINHFDQQFLHSQGIPYANTPGCNADSVVDYVMVSICLWALTKGRSLSDISVGILGCGQVGCRLLTRLSQLSIKVRVSDPPLAAQASQKLPFASLDEVFSADIVALHAPFTQTGQWPTKALVGCSLLELIPTEGLLLSCGRGEVVDEEALKAWAASGQAVIDVWQQEPEVDQKLLSAAWIATPHIAGYSLDGRINGTLMLRQIVLKLLAPDKPPPLPDIALTTPTPLRLQEASVESAMKLAIQVFDPRIDDRALRASQLLENKAQGFEESKYNCQRRRDFRHYTVHNNEEKLDKILRALGFQVEP